MSKMANYWLTGGCGSKYFGKMRGKNFFCKLDERRKRFRVRGKRKGRSTKSLNRAKSDEFV